METNEDSDGKFTLFFFNFIDIEKGRIYSLPTIIQFVDGKFHFI